MTTLYYVIFSFLIIIVTFIHDSCSGSETIIAIFLRAFDAVIKYSKCQMTLEALHLKKTEKKKEKAT